MNKLLINGFREVKTRLNQFTDKYNEIRFGLSLISQKRYNYYFRIVMLSSSVVTTGIYFSYNTLFINKYKSLVHFYSSGDLSPLDPSLERLAQNVWNDYNKKHNKSSDLIQFFPSVGSEPIKIGSLGLISGAHIGLPFNFKYNTIEDVKTTDIRFIGEHNPYAKWRSDSGQLFIRSLVLSEDAKRFAVAKQIYSANNSFLFIDCLNVGISTIVGIGSAQEIFKRTKIFKDFKTKFIVRTFSMLFGLYLWLTLNKIFNYYTGLIADKKTISLGDNYLNGAIEYYSKQKARNAAVIDLVDENRLKIYTEEGELKGFWNRYVLTIEKRINYLKAIKQIDKIEDKSN